MSFCCAYHVAGEGAVNDHYDQRAKQNRHQYFGGPLNPFLNTAPDNHNDEQIHDRVPKKQAPGIVHEVGKHCRR
jgi:hypothetical protein